MSFLTTFEDWVDRSFSRLFPAGRRFTLDDVAAGLFTAVQSDGQDGVATRYRVLFNPHDLERLDATSCAASIHLRTALAKLARARRGTAGGGPDLKVAVSDLVARGNWMLEHVSPDNGESSRTVIIEPRIEARRVPSLRINEEIYILIADKLHGSLLELPQNAVVLWKKRISIGRASVEKSMFDISINDMSVTGRKAHAFVSVVGDIVTVLDNQSTNGITVNSRKVSEQVLNHGDEIGLGRSVMRFEWINVDMEILESHALSSLS